MRASAHVGLGRVVAGVGKWRAACASFDAARSLEAASAPVRALAHACYEFYGIELGVATDPVGAALEYLALTRNAADPRDRIFWTVQLGRLESELAREHTGPEARFEEALTLARGVGDLSGEAFATFGLGTHLVGLGRYDEAIPILGEAARVHGETAQPRYQGWSLGFAALAHMARERWDEALPLFHESIGLLRRVGDAPREAHFLAFRGALGAMHAAKPEELERARIRVEDTAGPILMLGGSDDAMWPSCDFMKAGMDKLHETGHDAKFADEAQCFVGAGHDVLTVGLPTGDSMWAQLGDATYSLGGSARANAHAGRRSDDAIKAFLSRVAP